MKSKFKVFLTGVIIGCAYFFANRNKHIFSSKEIPENRKRGIRLKLQRISRIFTKQEDEEKNMWFKIIICACQIQEGTKKYAMFCSEDNPESTAIPVQQYRHSRDAYAEAETLKNRYRIDYRLVDPVRILVVPTVQPEVDIQEQINQKLEDAIQPFLIARISPLMNSVYWERAVNSQPMVKQFSTGFNVFRSVIEKESDEYNQFLSKQNYSTIQLEKALSSCFENLFVGKEAKSKQA